MSGSSASCAFLSPGCRVLGRSKSERVGGAVWPRSPGYEHVRSQADGVCVFWQRKPGADG